LNHSKTNIKNIIKKLIKYFYKFNYLLSIKIAKTKLQIMMNLKSFKIKLFSLIFVILLSILETAKAAEGDSCKNDGNCGFQHVCKNINNITKIGICEHKSLLPPNGIDVLGMLLVFITSICSSVAGNILFNLKSFFKKILKRNRRRCIFCSHFCVNKPN